MKTKKSLGQNFLNSPKIIDDIVSASEIKKGGCVLEIGPGEGALTESLLKAGATVVAVEKDERLIPFLKNKFANEIKNKQLEIIEGDILELELKKIITGNYKLVANIPYYITGLIIRKFLEDKHKPTLITLLVQKEVAERIVAKDGKESLLSLSVKLFGKPKYIRTVLRGAFKPQPTVDSAVIRINDILQGKNKDLNEKIFFDMLHAGFAHKRKKLISNLSSSFSKEDLTWAFDSLKFGENTRAEDLNIENWISLYNKLKEKSEL